ncbi:hypothetical protein BC937DRAFT_94900 [Endogone sp. FLAS-F59071]|nr:hypothetical protein BC937DRAFT_94900 [Endogone sp. FLAS-F59071]|eukprot:RUS13705.1 hypothetical protein BC937DRAFT_94900 [Endogone sp. FLAS-F59071]
MHYLTTDDPDRSRSVSKSTSRKRARKDRRSTRPMVSGNPVLQTATPKPTPPSKKSRKKQPPATLDPPQNLDTSTIHADPGTPTDSVPYEPSCRKQPSPISNQSPSSILPVCELDIATEFFYESFDAASSASTPTEGSPLPQKRRRLEQAQSEHDAASEGSEVDGVGEPAESSAAIQDEMVMIPTITMVEPRKRKKKLREPGAPKRNMNPYMFFSKDNRDKFVIEHPGFKLQEIARLTGIRWRAMTKDEKKPYEDMAIADRERYAEERRIFEQKTKAFEDTSHLATCRPSLSLSPHPSLSPTPTPIQSIGASSPSPRIPCSNSPRSVDSATPPAANSINVADHNGVGVQNSREIIELLARCDSTSVRGKSVAAFTEGPDQRLEGRFPAIITTVAMSPLDAHQNNRNLATCLDPPFFTHSEQQGRPFLPHLSPPFLQPQALSYHYHVVPTVHLSSLPPQSCNYSQRWPTRLADELTHSPSMKNVQIPSPVPLRTLPPTPTTPSLPLPSAAATLNHLSPVFNYPLQPPQSTYFLPSYVAPPSFAFQASPPGFLTSGSDQGQAANYVAEDAGADVRLLCEFLDVDLDAYERMMADERGWGHEVGEQVGQEERDHVKIKAEDEEIGEEE